MNMPGFSAEASLYRTSERYRIVAAGISTRGGQLLPQQTANFRELNRPFFACYFAHEMCVSRCSRRPIPFDELCRMGCKINYNNCLSG